MAKTQKTSTPVRPATLKHSSVSEVQNVYVNVSCSESLKQAATAYAKENGLGYPQDVFRVAATQFLKKSGYLKF